MNNLSESSASVHPFRDFNISTFQERVMEMYRQQYAGNKVYRQYCELIRGRSLPGERADRPVNTTLPATLAEIPFLPVRFFKSHPVITGEGTRSFWFESSGTTQTVQSRHYVQDVSLYEQSFREAFRIFYGDPRDYCILSLLPSYLERGRSSLVYMADVLMKDSGHPDSGFYLDQFSELHRVIRDLEARGQKAILLGVTFALLDFAEAFPMPLKHTIVMETGGMKGRRRELTREEVHGRLKERWGLQEVHAEYGMTELLSQAYARGEGRFTCPPWMRVILRGEDDPLSLTDERGQLRSEGLINIIDLANLHSCAFIATDDLGRLHPDGSFEVLGRMDNADLRGCSLLTA